MAGFRSLGLPTQWSRRVETGVLRAISRESVVVSCARGRRHRTTPRSRSQFSEGASRVAYILMMAVHVVPSSWEYSLLQRNDESLMSEKTIR